MTGTQMAAPRGESNLFAEIGGTEPLTMSSREIAGLCEKKHQHVRRDIEAMCTGLEIDVSSFGRIYIDARNREQTEFSLPKDLTLTLVAGYNVKLRKRIIDRWMELEKDAQSKSIVFDPNDPAQLLPLLTNYAERTQVAEAQVTMMSPKAEAYDRLDCAEGSYGPRLAAKALGHQERKFTRWLEMNNWAFRQGGGPLQAYKQKREAGYLDHKLFNYTDQNAGEEKTRVQMVVTPKGMARLAQLLPKEGGAA